MRRRNKDLFNNTAMLNNATYCQYVNRLTEMCLSRFEWKNLPDTIDERFLELCLFEKGMCVFFKDDVMGYLALNVTIGGKLTVYNIPTKRRAFATNGYQMELDETNSVIIYNNYLHKNSKLDVEMFAQRLYNIDRAIDVNANAQKTPILINCTEAQRLTLMNIYKQYDGNEPVIFGNKGLDTNSLKVLQTNAPYVCDKLYTLKTEIWNEALTDLGISNINISKKERLITDEVSRNMGGVLANRFSVLESRRQAVEQINKMFGLNIEVNFREDFDSRILEDVNTGEGEINE